eukprot:4545560-Prorocentrum_lima.AAC.1
MRGFVTALKEKCKGDLHKRGRAQCKKASGQMRVHKHGSSTSQSVLSADLSGPNPNAVATTYTYLFVAVLY